MLDISKVDNPDAVTKTVRVLQFGGNLSTEIPKDQHGDEKISKLGFATIMSQFFIPTLNLSFFDAFEFRVRVVCIDLIFLKCLNHKKFSFNKNRKMGERG